MRELCPISLQWLQHHATLALFAGFSLLTQLLLSFIVIKSETSPTVNTLSVLIYRLLQLLYLVAAETVSYRLLFS